LCFSHDLAYFNRDVYLSYKLSGDVFDVLERHKSLLAHHIENVDEIESSSDEGGDAVNTGDASGDDWSRELTRARVVQGLKEMVVALVEVGDFSGAQRITTCLHSLTADVSTNKSEYILPPERQDRIE